VISRPRRNRDGAMGHGLGSRIGPGWRFGHGLGLGFVIAALFIASLAIPAHAAAPTDSLWQKAVALAGSNARWVPGTIYTRVEEVDDAGKPKHVHEAWMRLYADSTGEVANEITKAIEDGKDVTEKERATATEQALRDAEQRARKEQDLAKRAKERGIAVEQLKMEEGKGDASELSIRFGGPTPFDPEIQEQITASRIEAPDPPPGGPHVAFQFVEPITAKTALRGIAWLNAATGVPVELRFSPDPLPSRVKEMAMIVRFEVRPDSAWLPVEMHVDAMGKLLFFKKRFRSTMTFDDHWWKTTD
jgi:hypothetical protein